MASSRREIAAFNTQIAAIPEAAAAGLTDYAAFLSFREDYLNGVKEAGGEADKDVEALLYRVYGGTNWYTIEELEKSMEAYDVQNESPVLQISDYQSAGYPEPMIQREMELAVSDLRHSLLPSPVKHSTQEYGKDLAVWCVLSIVLLLSPNAGAGPAAEHPAHAVGLPPRTVRFEHPDGGPPCSPHWC